MRLIIVVILGIIVIASCDNSGREQNRTIKEAAAIHEEILVRYDSLFEALSSENERINDALKTGISNPKRKSAYESMKRSIEKSFRLLASWEESLVSVPGVEHHHHDGHHHHHDHSKDNIVASMSDKEILELQLALKTRLDEVATGIRGLLTTIEMYDQNG